MAKKTFYVDIDLNGNELQHAVIHPVGALPPSAKEGQIAYNIGDKQVHFYDGTAWHTMGEVQDIVESDPITVTTANGIYTIGITAATPTKAGSLSGADKLKLDNLKQVDDDTDVPHIPITGTPLISGPTVNAALASADSWMKGHVAVGSRPHGELLQTDKDDDPLLAANSNDKVSSQRAVKTYVDALVGTGSRPPEPYDPTITSAYPLKYAGGAIKKGDHFIITKAGTVGAVGTIPVNPNDSLIANQDAPTQVDANWTVIAATVTIPDASETVKGIAMIATQAEVDAGTNDNDIVTPLKLKAAFKAQKDAKVAIASGTGVNLQAVHNFGTRDVVVSCYKGDELIDAQVVTTSANQVDANINNPASFSWRMVVVGVDNTP